MKPAKVSTIGEMFADALHLHQSGRLAEAAAIYREILVADRRHADSLNLLGVIEKESGNFQQAVDLLRRAIAIRRNDATYHSNLGTVYQAAGKLDEAAACYRRAIALKPGYAEAHSNLGGALLDLARLAEAIAAYEKAVSLDSGNAAMLTNLGNSLLAANRNQQAVACYQSALRMNPNFALAGYGMASAQLLDGDFAEGWKNFEWRWKTPGHSPMRNYPRPLWQGEKLPAGSLLIWGEQGVGDEIMFAGLLPEAAAINRCVLNCDKRLQPLFARSFPGVEVVQGERRGTDIAAHLPSGSLPRLLRPSIESFSRTTSPYLKPNLEKREQLRQRYSTGKRIAGVAWHTSNRITGYRRCIPLPSLAPLFAHSDISWVSLQYGDPDDLERQIKLAQAPIFVDRQVDQLTDVDLFASQIAAMDLVVTIDNSTAHLAGALGVPVWLLLPSAPDFRWVNTHPDGSPWYPSMRLFRQQVLGDWAPVIERVSKAL